MYATAKTVKTLQAFEMAALILLNLVYQKSDEHFSKSWNDTFEFDEVYTHTPVLILAKSPVVNLH